MIINDEAGLTHRESNRLTSIRQGTLANATEGTIMIDTNNQIIQLNLPALALLRYEAHQLINQPIQVVIPEFNCSCNDITYTNKLCGIYTARKKSGDEFSAEIYVHYCKNSPGTSAFVFIVAQTSEGVTLLNLMP